MGEDEGEMEEKTRGARGEKALEIADNPKV